MSVIDRLAGVTEGLGRKAPVRCATTAAIALAGLLTVDGIALTAGDRVLVKNQTSAVENGIWVASTGPWSRAPDFDGARDVVAGTTVYDPNSALEYAVRTPNPVLPGTSAITFGAITSAEGIGRKAPVRCATTANITLSGLQTVDTVALAAGDRVLVKNQTSAVNNGIWIAATGAWTRALDFDTSTDVLQGTAVYDANRGVEYALTTASPVPGTSSLAFAARTFASSAISDSTAIGRGLLTAADAAAAKDALDLVAADITDSTATGRGLLTAANQAAARAAIGSYTSSEITHAETGGAPRALALIFKESIRSISDFPGADDNAKVVNAFASGARRLILPEKGTDWATGKITVPSTLKELIGVGRPSIVPVAGTFTSSPGFFNNEWADAPISYTVGQAVQFTTTGETAALGLTTDGLIYRALVGGAGNAPARYTQVTTVSGTSVITVGATTGIAAGHKIQSARFPAGTTVSSIVDANHLQMSANALSSGTDGSVQFVSPFWTYVPYEAFWTFNGLADALVVDATLSVNPYEFPQVKVGLFSGCTGLVASRLNVPLAGAIGLELANCIDATLEDPRVGTFAWRGINVQGSTLSQSRSIRVNGAKVDTLFIGTAHCIAVNLSEDVVVMGATGTGSRTAGLASNAAVDLKSIGNTWKNTRREGELHLGLVKGQIKDFTIIYEGSSSADFGLSLDGLGVVCADVEVTGGFVTGAWMTGIECVGNPAGGVYRARIHDNTVLDCNGADLATEGGIALFGVNTQFCEVKDNRIWDTRGTPKHRFGVGEIDLGGGLGMPSNNRLGPNESFGYLTAPTIRGGTTTKIRDANDVRTSTVSQASGIAAAAGTITAATGTLRWGYEGDYVVIHEADVTITTLGTATGSIVVTLPVAGVAQAGVLKGKEIATTGKGVSGEINGATVALRCTDNTVAWANGTRFIFEGKYRSNAA